MEKIRLGRTELLVSKTSFGALPIQRISKADAVKLVRRAYDAGVNYFDTANAYTDSEEKLGAALHDVRQNVVISTKSAATDKKNIFGIDLNKILIGVFSATFWRDINNTSFDNF